MARAAERRALTSASFLPWALHCTILVHFYSIAQFLYSSCTLLVQLKERGNLFVLVALPEPISPKLFSRIMLTSNSYKGRVARVTKAMASLGVVENSWSVILDDTVDKHAGPFSDGTPNGPLGFVPTTQGRYLKVLFYSTKADAWEESAVVGGLRPDETEETKVARRNRSLSAGSWQLSMMSCGRMGIGLVEGERNLDGSRMQGGVLVPASTYTLTWEKESLLLAVENSKCSMVGTESSGFPDVVEGAIKHTKAKVVAVNGEVVTIDVLRESGGASQWVQVIWQMDSAKLYFAAQADPLDGTLRCDAFPAITRWAREAGALSTLLDSGRVVQVRFVLMAAAAAGLLPLVKWDIIKSGGAGELRAALADFVPKLEKKLSALVPVKDAVAEARRMAGLNESDPISPRSIGLAVQEFKKPETRGGGFGSASDAAPVFDLGGAASGCVVLDVGSSVVSDGASAGAVAGGASVMAASTLGDAPSLTLDAELRAKRGADEELWYADYARCFARAASLESFDAFVRMSALTTMEDEGFRETILNSGSRAEVHLACASALDAFLRSLGAVAAPATLQQLVPSRGSGAGLNAAALQQVLSSLAARKAPAAGPTMPQQIVVMPQTELQGVPDVSQQEVLSLGQDALEVVQSTQLREELQSLSNLEATGDYARLFQACSNAGAPLRRLLGSAEDVMRVFMQKQWPNQLSTAALGVRSALERRIWVSVLGSTAADPSADAQRAYKFLRQGRLSKARPSLLVKGSCTSSVEDPLSFLASLPAGQQTAELLAVFARMTLALQVAFPAQSLVTGRFFLALQIWILEQRNLGASWSTLSAWYAGLLRKADRRVDRYAMRQAASLDPLDPAWITDQAASYTAEYLAARAPEMAQSAASKLHEEAGGSATVRQKELRAFVQAELARQKPGIKKPEPGKGGIKRTAEKEAADKAKKAKKEADDAARQAGGQLVRGTGESGKAVADKSVYLNATTGKFKTQNLPELRGELKQELGEWQGKDPCVFFHINGKCSHSAQKCHFYH